ncbi:hypothetical protein ACFL7M_12715 [Thermodesulfobacteriota bacterium]
MRVPSALRPPSFYPEPLDVTRDHEPLGLELAAERLVEWLVEGLPSVVRHLSFYPELVEGLPSVVCLFILSLSKG